MSNQETPSKAPSVKLLSSAGALSSIGIAVIKSSYLGLPPDSQEFWSILTPVIVAVLTGLFEYAKHYLGMNSPEDVAVRGKIKRDLERNTLALEDPHLKDPEMRQRLIEERYKLMTKPDTLEVLPSKSGTKS